MGPEILNAMGLAPEVRLARIAELRTRLDAASQTGTLPEHADSLVDLADLHLIAHDLPQAEACYRQALDAAGDRVSTESQLRSLAGLVQVELLRANYDRALELGHQALQYRTTIDRAARVCEVLCKLARASLALGQWEKARCHAREALELAQNARETEPVAICVAQRNMASALSAMDGSGEAESLLRQAFAGTEEHLGPRHPYTSELMSDLAMLLWSANRLGEAESLMRRALSIHEMSYAPDHPEVAVSLSGLAVILISACRPAEGRPLLERALAIAETRLGPEHPTTAGILCNLALALMGLNRLADAETAMRRALALREKAFGPDHVQVERFLDNLAHVLREVGRLDEAEALLKRALAIVENGYGLEHPSVARVLSSLGLVMEGQSRFSEAEQMLRRALAISEKSNPAGVVFALRNLGMVLHASGRLEEAEVPLRKALAIGERLYGPDHLFTAAFTSNLAQWLQDAGRLPEAEAMYRRALAIAESSYGSDHWCVVGHLRWLAQLFRVVGRYGDAEALARRALAIGEKAHGLEHGEIVRDLNLLAAVLVDAERFGEAEPFLLRAVAIEEKWHGSTRTLANVLSYLAAVLRAKGCLSEARSVAARAVRILADLSRSMGRQHPDMPAMLDHYRLILRDLHLGEAQIRRELQEAGVEVPEPVGPVPLFSPEFCEKRCPICTRARRGSRVARLLQRIETRVTFGGCPWGRARQRRYGVRPDEPLPPAGQGH